MLAKPFQHLNPGSPEAVEKGCLCPQDDNRGGLGYSCNDMGRSTFWINIRCPLHGRLAPKIE